RSSSWLVIAGSEIRRRICPCRNVLALFMNPVSRYAGTCIFIQTPPFECQLQVAKSGTLPSRAPLEPTSSDARFASLAGRDSGFRVRTNVSYQIVREPWVHAAKSQDARMTRRRR